MNRVPHFNAQNGSELLSYFRFRINTDTVELIWSPAGRLRRIDLQPGKPCLNRYGQIPADIQKVADQLISYCLQGEPFADIDWRRIDQSDWTEFQKRVYRIISEIPHGETRTYGWVANRLGKHNAGRAVGQALRNNPLPILIPCHRVVGSHSLGGFMGAADSQDPEVELKRRLIRLEEEYRSPIFSFLKPSLRGAMPVTA